MDEVTRAVARQYEAWTYPPPLADLDAAIAGGYHELGAPHRHAPLLWPLGRPAHRLRMLSAGCGTVQAAYLAHTSGDAEVVGVDLSAASLAHERYLMDRHRLANLRLFQGDLREVASLGSFDHIVCSGVLHHLDDPDAGLRALHGVLAPGGTLLLMVYGATARAGVYQVQDALRRLHVTQTAEGVAFARRLVAQLPDHHYARWYIGAATELQHDAAFVDTFLHPQDRAYTVPELLAFVERNRFVLHAWADNAPVYPDAALARFDDAVRGAVAALPEREQWAVVESLTLRIGMHTCVLRRAEDAPHPAPHAFGSAGAVHQVAHAAPGLQRERGATATQPALYRRGTERLELGALEAALLDACDGRRSLHEVLLTRPELAAMPEAERAARGERFFARLWRMGHLMVERRPG